jgi:hypothetical protein
MDPSIIALMASQSVRLSVARADAEFQRQVDERKAKPAPTSSVQNR